MLSSTVDVHLDLTEPGEQSIKVTVRWTPSTHRLILKFPLWTPGSYTVRDPVQHLHSLRLSSATGPVACRRLAPNRWLVDLKDLSALELTYVIEARDLTVRTAHLDPDFAAISLAAVVMEVEGCRWMRHRLAVTAPAAWTVHCRWFALETHGSQTISMI